MLIDLEPLTVALDQVESFQYPAINLSPLLLVKGTDARHVRKQELDAVRHDLEESVAVVLQLADRLSAVHRSLEIRAASLANACAPVTALPTELLSEIFKLVAYSPDPRMSSSTCSYAGTEMSSQSRIDLSHVCSEWRGIMLGIPELWTLVQLPSHDPPTMLNEFIRRSRSLSVDIAFLSLEYHHNLDSFWYDLTPDHDTYETPSISLINNCDGELPASWEYVGSTPPPGRWLLELVIEGFKDEELDTIFSIIQPQIIGRLDLINIMDSHSDSTHYDWIWASHISHLTMTIPPKGIAFGGGLLQNWRAEDLMHLTSLKLAFGESLVHDEESDPLTRFLYHAKGIEELDVSGAIEGLQEACSSLCSYMSDHGHFGATAPFLRRLRMYNLEPNPTDQQLNNARSELTEMIYFRWERTEIADVNPLEELEISEELVVPGFAYFPDGNGKLTLIPSEK